METTEQHRKYCESLTDEERMLLVLRDDLYAGSWEAMRQDLEDRLAGRPYIYRLANRIREDLERIARLSAYEASNGIDIGDLITPSAGSGEQEHADQT